MAFSDTQSQQVSTMMNAWLETNRPPEHIRPQLDLGWRIEKQSVFVYEIRPQWNDPSIINHYDFGKATWVERAREWRTCNDRTGNCSFSGNQFYCFAIEAVAGCETSFTGQAVFCGSQREAVYTFTSKDAFSYIKIQGGLTNFTGADAEVTISGGNLSSSQRTPGGSSNRVITVEGSVGACEAITITIMWNSTNTGGIITGDWSVKDAYGVELAPSVAGLTCL